MLTISQLGRKFGLSRSTLLYYEREGLLPAARRSDSGYRYYGPAEVQCLERLLAYRELGVPLAEIRELLAQGDDNLQAGILQRQLQRLEREILRLRQQQRTILSFLQTEERREETMVNKERWTEIMRAAGLSDDDMRNWHQQFEKLEPQAHEEFLQSLGIEQEEVARIRRWSRGEG